MWDHGFLKRYEELEDGREDINEFQRLHRVFIFVTCAWLLKHRLFVVIVTVIGQSCDPLVVGRCLVLVMIVDFGGLVFCVCVVFFSLVGASASHPPVVHLLTASV